MKLTVDGTQSTAAAEGLRKDPYKLFFPLGILLGLAGVTPWLALGLGRTSSYPTLFHSVVQIEGFLSAFAVGFLFTFVPRRTGTSAPRVWQLAAVAAGLLSMALLGWFGRWMLSQAAWLAAMGVAFVYVGRRVLRPGSGVALDGRFVWIPAGLAMGLLGAILTGVAAVGRPMLHAVGQALLTQGMFTALVIGVGQLVLPNFLYAARPPVGARRLFGAHGAIHLTIAALFAATFPLEIWIAPPLCAAVRAIVAFSMVVIGTGVYRVPTQPGSHRLLIAGAAWMIPLGYALMALFPAHRIAAEHVLFIGGFAVVTFGVSIHVALSHAGHGEVITGRPWQVSALAILAGAAVVFRGLMSLDPPHYLGWMAMAAGAFLGAALLWAQLVFPALTPGRRP